MHNGYRFAELGPGESLQSPDACDCCGREGLKKTVKLVNPTGRVVWFGTGCAARAMGLRPLEVRAAKAGAEARAEANAIAARRQEEARQDAAWTLFLSKHAPGLDRFEAIQALGGMAAARAKFKAEMV
jgi:hypothetical protein